MERKVLIAKAREHWEEWLPEKTQGLKEAGEFKAETRAAARRAHAEIAELIVRGHQEREAEKVVLPKHILLEPEPPAPPFPIVEGFPLRRRTAGDSDKSISTMEMPQAARPCRPGHRPRIMPARRTS